MPWRREDARLLDQAQGAQCGDDGDRGSDPGGEARARCFVQEARENRTGQKPGVAGEAKDPQLMAELSKVRRVIERRMPGQPRHVLLVLDAVIGQNGLAQAEAFAADAGVTGVVLAKLDGTAKGGVAVAIADRLGLPIVFAGVGEEAGDLAPFDPAAYAEWLLSG